MTDLSRLKIVLVETAGALNLGSVARVMKNMGLQQLILVNPLCDRHSDEAKKMAVHAQDILDQAQEVASLPDALMGCQRAIATTGRTRSPDLMLETPRQGLPWIITENLTTALIFGPEDRGLSNEELQYAQRYVGIPSHPTYPSLNLAQAVAVCTYEIYQYSLQSLSATNETLRPPASIDRLEGYYQHLEQLLLDIGYLYPHTAAARMKKVRRIYNRATLTEEDLALLRGMLSQIDWYRQHFPPHSSQTDVHLDGVTMQD